MEDLRNIIVDIYPDCVELSIDDFEYIIEAALCHHDEFFVTLLERFDEAREGQDAKISKS